MSYFLQVGEVSPSLQTFEKAFSLEEVKKKSSHFWDTIYKQTLEKNVGFEKIGADIATLFAQKSMIINYTNSPYSLIFYDYKEKNMSIHNPRYGLLSRIIHHFNLIYNTKIKIKNICWDCQLDQKFYWLLVIDKKSKKALIFESL